MPVKRICLPVILVHIHLINMAFIHGMIHQSLSVAHPLRLGLHEQHFQHIIAQTHKGGDFSVSVADYKKSDSREIPVSDQWPEILDIFFFQKMMGTTHRFFPYSQQFIRHRVRQRRQFLYYHFFTTASDGTRNCDRDTSRAPWDSRPAPPTYPGKGYAPRKADRRGR